MFLAVVRFCERCNDVMLGTGRLSCSVLLSNPCRFLIHVVCCFSPFFVVSCSPFCVLFPVLCSVPRSVFLFPVLCSVPCSVFLFPVLCSVPCSVPRSVFYSPFCFYFPFPVVPCSIPCSVFCSLFYSLFCVLFPVLCSIHCSVSFLNPVLCCYSSFSVEKIPVAFYCPFCVAFYSSFSVLFCVPVILSIPCSLCFSVFLSIPCSFCFSVFLSIPCSLCFSVLLSIPFSAAFLSPYCVDFYCVLLGFPLLCIPFIASSLVLSIPRSV